MTGELFYLFQPFIDEVFRVFLDLLERFLTPVGLLAVPRPGDSVILDSGVDPHSCFLNIGADIVKGEIVTDVAIKIPVRDISRVALFAGPDGPR